MYVVENKGKFVKIPSAAAYQIAVHLLVGSANEVTPLPPFLARFSITAPFGVRFGTKLTGMHVQII